MHWEMGFSFAPGSKVKNQQFKKSENQNADIFDVSMPISSWCKTQKSNISGFGFYTLGKHDFVRNPAQTKKHRFIDFRIRGELSFSISQSFRIFEAPERAKSLVLLCFLSSTLTHLLKGGGCGL